MRFHAATILAFTAIAQGSPVPSSGEASLKALNNAIAKRSEPLVGHFVARGLEVPACSPPEASDMSEAALVKRAYCEYIKEKVDLETSEDLVQRAVARDLGVSACSPPEASDMSEAALVKRAYCEYIKEKVDLETSEDLVQRDVRGY